MEVKTFSRRTTSFGIPMATLALLGMGFVVWPVEPIMAQNPANQGVISGSVTADRGEVHAFRVKATDTDHRIAYTVFTRTGRFQIFNLPPSNYEVQVLEIGFDSPVEKVDLKAGETKTVDLVLRANAVRSPRGEGGYGPGAYTGYGGTQPPQSPQSSRMRDTRGDIVKLVDFDTLYPPSPARDVMMTTCFGCHGANGDSLAQRAWHRRLTDEEGWRTRVNRMFVRSPLPGGGHRVPWVTADHMSAEQKENIIKYLAVNFGLDSEPRDLKLDPLVRDEAALAQAIFVQYEGLTGHDPAVSVQDPGVVYLSDLFKNDSIVAVDTHNLDYATRQKEWRIEGRDAGPHGLIEHAGGKVMWAGMGGDHIGELDPKTGEMRLYPTPTEGGHTHTLRADSRGDVWYTYMRGVGKIGRWDYETKIVTDNEVPAKAFNGYGIIVDTHDRVWLTQIGAPANEAPAVRMYDPKTDKWTAFQTSSPTRRLTQDSKGRIWANQYFGNRIVRIDPVSGEVTEFPLPLKYGNLYEIWADLEDNIWASNSVYNSLVKFDQTTEEFTYYPFPEFRTHVPKMEVDSQGTLWFGLDRFALTGFKPEGNVPLSGSTSR